MWHRFWLREMLTKREMHHLDGGTPAAQRREEPLAGKRLLQWGAKISDVEKPTPSRKSARSCGLLSHSTSPLRAWESIVLYDKSACAHGDRDGLCG